MKVKSESEVAQLCPTLRDPKDRSPPGSLSLGFSRKSTGVGCRGLLRPKELKRLKTRSCSGEKAPRSHGWQRSRAGGFRDAPGGPLAKNRPCGAGHVGTIPGQGTRNPHAAGQLGPHTTTAEPVSCSGQSHTTQQRICVPQLRPDTAKQINIKKKKNKRVQKMGHGAG